jgi:MscS family membrane protein
MKRRFLLLLCTLTLVFGAAAPAQTQPAPPPAQADAAKKSAETQDRDDREAQNNNAAAAVQSTRFVPRTPDFLEHIVDEVLALFDVANSGNTVTHYVISMLLLVGAFLLRRVVTGIIFAQLKRLASRTQTTLDDKLFPALEAPVATFVMVVGIVASLKVLKLPLATDDAIGYGSTIAFSLVIFWGLLRAFNSVLDHAAEVARTRQLGIAAFMPWIKKTLVTVFVVFGILLVAQSLGADVKAFLAGLGIGGLAFALAAQDTIANLFGSIVVAIDQPFKIGETVQIGAHTGLVEDIGLRSTKLRRVDKSLVVIPNKTVAAEPITNLSRFTQRRVEQTIGLTYDAKPEQIEAIVAEIRQIILREDGIDTPSVIVQFTNYGPSSLDIWIVYLTLSPDFLKHLQLKERINLAIMRAVNARGLSFAFPTQTVHLEGDIARKLAERGAGAPPVR